MKKIDFKDDGGRMLRILDGNSSVNLHVSSYNSAFKSLDFHEVKSSIGGWKNGWMSSVISALIVNTKEQGVNITMNRISNDYLDHIEYMLTMKPFDIKDQDKLDASAFAYIKPLLPAMIKEIRESRNG